MWVCWIMNLVWAEYPVTEALEKETWEQGSRVFFLKMKISPPLPPSFPVRGRLLEGATTATCPKQQQRQRRR
ncbi:hypothetical protein QBC39DRAFT_360490 [Podospora conica]|nr:hypothetical protein QBC39DRAFT_360490 [Schizothecium conicum]